MLHTLIKLGGLLQACGRASTCQVPSCVYCTQCRQCLREELSIHPTRPQWSPKHTAGQQHVEATGDRAMPY
jgi:hypothetical protein